MSEIVIRHSETTDAQTCIIFIRRRPSTAIRCSSATVRRVWQKRLANPEPGTHNLAAIIDGQLADQLV